MISNLQFKDKKMQSIWLTVVNFMLIETDN